MDYQTGCHDFTNILHLTDFSTCSDNALEWAVDLAHAHQAKIAMVHAVIPDALTYMTPDSPMVALDIQEEWARGEMQRREARLAGLSHETFLLRGKDAWSVVAPKVAELQSDLLVLGTHGRTGFRKLLLGSVAEQVLRQATVPVMTVGADVLRCAEAAGNFHRVLLATNFSAGSIETAGYATALARRDHGQLFLLHACKANPRGKSTRTRELSIAEALHRLHELAPVDEHSENRPEAIVELGDAGTKILEVAKRKSADLIVMGLRDAGSVFAATHLETGTAHAVVAHAVCPVLTVRPHIRRAA
jgi:nucleotide-binding universal stress UspA family protein